MSNSKFSIQSLPDFSEVFEDTNTGATVVECENKTYKYGVSHLSDSIAAYDSDDYTTDTGIADAKAVHDYVHTLSTSLSADIASSKGLLTDGKAVHDYVKNEIGKIDGLFGPIGTVAYLKPEGVEKQTIFHNDVYICENDDD